MSIILYYHPASPPCHTVMLTAAAVGVELDLKFINTQENDHPKPEFLKINPQHTVPTIDDNGFILWESRAICTYLIEKYAKNYSLYPKDPKQRAIINQRLFFDMGTLYHSFIEYFYPQIATGAPADPAKLEKCHEALNYLEKFLEGQNYVAGNQMTVADLATITSVVFFSLMGSDISKHKNTLEWMERIKFKAPKYIEIMDKGVQALKVIIERVVKK